MLFRKHNILERVCGVGWDIFIFYNVVLWGIVGVGAPKIIQLNCIVAIVS